jgi:hypothetical protein
MYTFNYSWVGREGGEVYWESGDETSNGADECAVFVNECGVFAVDASGTEPAGEAGARTRLSDTQAGIYWWTDAKQS